MPEARLQIDAGAVSWTPTDDGQIVVLDLASSKYLALNGTAALLWQQLSDGSDEDTLVRSLLESCDGVEESQARTDVEEFVTQLRSRGLLLA
jgi:Coenzyme PQQ synthesis protein D (PqqD)